MSPTQVEISQLDKFFKSITVPKVVQINKAIRQTDAPKFISENIEMLKNKALNDRVAERIWGMLQELKTAILEGTG